ncbi:hypothetical protein V1478_002693 [Vespula squamosa]|uniref:Uncharacterized protein n=1 Tax=Vespula squamosa TaxID=30214 RepID=A0ABD2BTB3_VESSQ
MVEIKRNKRNVILASSTYIDAVYVGRRSLHLTRCTIRPYKGTMKRHFQCVGKLGRSTQQSLRQVLISDDRTSTDVYGNPYLSVSRSVYPAFICTKEESGYREV